LQFLDALLLLKALSAFSSALLSTSSSLLSSLLFVFEVLTTLHFSQNSLLVVQSTIDQAALQSIFNHLVPIFILDLLQLNLLVQSRHEMSPHAELLPSSQQSHIFQSLHCVSLEVPQELLRHGASDLPLFLAVSEDLVNSLLQVAPISFVVSTCLTGLDSLGLDEHGLALLLVPSVVLG